MQFSTLIKLGMGLITGLRSVSAQVAPFKYDRGVAWIHCGPADDWSWTALKLYCDANCVFGKYDEGTDSNYWYATILDSRKNTPVYITVWFKTWNGYDFINKNTLVFDGASYSTHDFYDLKQTPCKKGGCVGEHCDKK